jgi:hypothetical protein
MRWVLTIIIILVLIFAASFWSLAYLSNSSKEIDQDINVLDQNIRNAKWGEASRSFEVLDNRWGITKGKWTMLLDHMEIDNIDKELAKLKQYIITKDLNEALAELATVKLLFEHIPQKEQFNVENVL